ncbi:hypothetical protein [Marinicella sp. W31]|uniref:hypothetical protein n=1 Tax=Marinicella sp. W31 TaxID=3023713 RepID=UPI00375669B4
MNEWFFIAGCLALVLGIVHSILGEKLIFRSLGKQRLVSSEDDRVLRKKHIRTLWSSWHLLTLFGWSFAAIMLMMAWVADTTLWPLYMRWILMSTFLISTVFWIFGTRGRHPAWIIFLLITVLIGLA